MLRETESVIRVAARGSEYKAGIVLEDQCRGRRSHVEASRDCAEARRACVIHAKAAGVT